MAYAALVSLAQTIDQILHHDQYPISPHSKQQIMSVQKCVVLLQRFLEDFPDKGNSLEGQVRDVANEVEDTIEYLTWERIRSRYGLIKPSDRPSKFKYVHHPYDFHDLKKVTEKIRSITKQVMSIKNSFRIEDKQQLCDSLAASSSSGIAPTHKDDIMIGFDDDLMAIKDRLCGKPSQLQVISIVGMGGIGKTTLARNVYDDPLVMEHFQIRAWVTVSQDYSAEEILRGILVFIQEFSTGRSSVSSEDSVYKTLKGRRYLIIMDDMWSTKAWDDVRNIFPDDNIGSRILLTTRLLDVAAYPNPSCPPHEMRFMDVDHSWKLLKQKVFTYRDFPPELEDVGRMLAGSCKGLPLAIVVVAGLLSRESKTRASWEKIAENVNFAVAAEQGQFEKILYLSYTHLPHYLRPCFLYLGGFPEDHRIRASKLIKLWVAEGFLKRRNGSKSLEEEAEEYLEDLVKRNLVLVTERKSNGKIKRCSLHDLMRDLCIRKAQEEKFLLNLKDRSVEHGLSVKSTTDQRRVSIACSALTNLSNICSSTIHTIMCFCDFAVKDSLESFRLLRVLDVEDTYVESSLPAPLFELFHLRYLAIKWDKKIPAAISKLRNLQTLIIHRTKMWPRLSVVEDSLPQEIWRMPKLRHLLFSGLLPDPKGITSTLGNLQTLSLVPLFMCSEGILKMIPNLKRLGIECSHCQGGTFFNNLVYLHQLENLELHSFLGYKVWRKDNFTFPAMLKKLTLSHLQLPWNEMTVVGSLPNLQVLKLRDYACYGNKWETTEGEFPQLEFLLIEESNLEQWITESSHFPRLKSLLLHRIWRLTEIPDDIGRIPALELIEMKGRLNKSLVESAKRIQEEQQSWGNDTLQVRCMTIDVLFPAHADTNDSLFDSVIAGP